jgi:predicted Zn-dependent protease
MQNRNSSRFVEQSIGMDARPFSIGKRTVKEGAMRKFYRFYLSTGLLAAAVSACGGPASSETSQGNDVPNSTQDLVVGSRGDDVRALHEYLTAFGYFPNAPLQERFPQWRPIVVLPPAAPDTFDEYTLEAVRHLQINNGLPSTGRVDEPTRLLLREERCGVPDGIESIDAADKFALNPWAWNRSNGTVSYSYPPDANYPPNLRSQIPAVRAAIDAAFAAWRRQISDVAGVGLSFAATTGTADIPIVFGTTPVGTNGVSAVGVTNVTRSGNSITSAPITLRSQDLTFSTAAAGMSNRHDVQSVMTHEIGHALGLNHSSVTGAVMIPGSRTGSVANRTLRLDDKVALTSRESVFAPVGCCFKDIAPAPDGSVWGIAAGAGDQPIWKFVPNASSAHRTDGTWVHANDGNGRASRITVDTNSVPWVATASGYVFSRLDNDANNSGWLGPLPLAHFGSEGAGDIAIGPTGELWMSGNYGNPGFSYGRVHKFDPGTWSWIEDHNELLAGRITIDATGTPWIMDGENRIRRYSSNDPLTGSWSASFGGSPFGPLGDLGIGPSNYLWDVLPVYPANTLLRLALLNNQGPDTEGANERVNVWVSYAGTPSFGANSAIAVDPTGTPWYIVADGTIWTKMMK